MLFSFNVGKRDPAKVDFTVSPQSVEFHLTDPKMPQGLHVTGKKSSSGNYADQNSPWSYKSDFNVKYSADPKKQITINVERKREVPQPERRKYTSSVEVIQESNNLKHKMYVQVGYKFFCLYSMITLFYFLSWNEAMLEPCKSGDPYNCDYIFVIGTQFNDQQKQPQDYSVDIRTTLLKGTYLVKLRNYLYIHITVPDKILIAPYLYLITHEN